MGCYHIRRAQRTPGQSAATTGLPYARNQTLVNIMRDYGYVDARGMGVRNKIIPGMRAHIGTEPELIEEEHRFTVRLWKKASALLEWREARFCEYRRP